MEVSEVIGVPPNHHPFEKVGFSMGFSMKKSPSSELAWGIWILPGEPSDLTSVVTSQTKDIMGFGFERGIIPFYEKKNLVSELI